MAYAADPGKVFASDAHRRVAGHLPHPGEEPTSIEALYARLYPDSSTPISSLGELEVVVGELAATGHLEKTPEGGLLMTLAGLEDLTAPAPEPEAVTVDKDPPPKVPAVIKTLDAADGVASPEAGVTPSE